MRIDLERRLRDLRGSVPYPRAVATESALAAVVDVVKRRHRGSRWRPVVIGLVIVVAASGASFLVGRSTNDEVTGGIPSAASFLPLASESATVLRPVAFRCRVQAFVVKWDGAGHVQLLEYTWGSKNHWFDHPVPTGRVLAYADNAARTFNPACVAVKPVLPGKRAYDTAPYDPHTKLQFYCNSLGDFRKSPLAGFVIQIRPVVRHGRLLGNRLLVQEGSHPKVASMIDATLAGRESRLAVRVQRCFKPFWE